jgi:hypothetical protein
MAQRYPGGLSPPVEEIGESMTFPDLLPTYYSAGAKT